MLAPACGWLLLLSTIAGAGVRHHLTLGRSVDGRPIVAIERGDPASPRKVLVVGCIHGNECAGTAIATRIAALRPPPGVDVWLIPNLNPDGAAVGSRGNGHGVDLNRNFPWHWQRLTGFFDSGLRPVSEPESRIAYRFILRVRPRISIWFHQHEQAVDESGGNIAVERRYSQLVGLPLRRLRRYPGSVTSWENHTFRGTTAFVVELPAGTLSATDANRHARAVLELARQSSSLDRVGARKMVSRG